VIKDKKLTFLYLPEGSQEPQTLQVGRNALVALTLTVLFALTISGAVVLHFSNRLADAYRMEDLAAQNRDLRHEIDALTGDVDQLRRQVAQNFDFQQKARILANLDELDADVAQVGVGGPGAQTRGVLTEIDPATRFRLATTRRDIEKLLRQARLQKVEYEEIVSRLEDANE